MTLQLSSLRLNNFRSYRQFVLDNLHDLTIFVGPNAIGKSNLLEAIQLTTALSSFRSATADHLIHWGCNSSSVITHLNDEKRHLEVKLLLDESGKQYYLNGKKTAPRTLHDYLPAVTFTPDDLQLVKGSPSQRRRALDDLGCQLSSNYQAVKRDYEKILRQRNQLLKEAPDPLLLDSVNEVFTKVGVQLCLYRLKIMNDLRDTFARQYGHLSSNGETATLSYRFSWDDTSIPPAEDALYSRSDDRLCEADRELLQQKFEHALQHKTAEEYSRKNTLIGPHRDHLDFRLGGRSAQLFASQGQQRSLAIAFKLSEYELIATQRHQQPILLLDDVMSEIDAERRSYLMEHLNQVTQTFITTTNLEYCTSDVLKRANVVSLTEMISRHKV